MAAAPMSIFSSHRATTSSGKSLQMGPVADESDAPTIILEASEDIAEHFQVFVPGVVCEVQVLPSYTHIEPPLSVNTIFCVDVEQFIDVQFSVSGETGMMGLHI